MNSPADSHRNRILGAAAALLLLVLGPLAAAADDQGPSLSLRRAGGGALLHGPAVPVRPELRLQLTDAAPQVRPRPWWRGRFEAGAHFSAWSIDPILSVFAGDVTDGLAREIRSEVLGQISTGWRPVVSTGYANGLGLDSSGSNAGFGVRYYPGGERGSFSVGFSFERTRILIALEGPVDIQFADGSQAEVRGYGAVETSPSSMQVDFRWEFGPGWRLSPYFTLGLGLAAFSGTVEYSYEGRYVWGGPEETVTGSDMRTFHDLGGENDVHVPDRIPMLHLGLGLRARVVQGFGLTAEAGLWNGLMLRGGFFYRF